MHNAYTYDEADVATCIANPVKRVHSVSQYSFSRPKVHLADIYLDASRFLCSVRTFSGGLDRQICLGAVVSLCQRHPSVGLP